MASFIFEPNNPEALVELWANDYNEWGDVGGNAWAVLTPERELVTLFTTDADGRWVFGDSPGMGGGMDKVIDAVRETGCDDVVGIHFHPTDDPPGPCPDLPDFARMAKGEMTRAGINLRFIIVGYTDGRVDGVLSFGRLPQPSPDLTDPETQIATLIELAQMRERMLADQELDDEQRELFLAAMDELAASIMTGEMADIDLILRAGLEATDILEAQGKLSIEGKLLREMAAKREPDINTMAPEPAPERKSVFDLPVINPADVKWMN